jgi:hypothetical protein
MCSISNPNVTPRRASLYSTQMTDNRKAGIALILGSIGGVVTVAIHPVGGNKLSPDEVGHFAWMSGAAHTLALASVLLLLLGSCGLTQTLAAPDRVAFSALVTFAFSTVGIMVAGTVSGWVVPGIMKLMAHDAAANAPAWRIAMVSIFQINQAMSRIYSVGAALAITLWSASSLQQSRLSRAVAVFGCIVAPLVALLILVGHLRVDVHGMTVVMVSEVVWFIGMGIGLLREDPHSQ